MITRHGVEKRTSKVEVRGAACLGADAGDRVVALGRPLEVHRAEWVRSAIIYGGVSYPSSSAS